MMRIEQRPEVDSDLADIYAFIALDKFDPAERFLEVARASIQRLGQHPYIGTVWTSDRPTLSGVRLYPMPNPYRAYSIVYRIQADTIDVLRVVPGMRDLEFVLGRLE